MSSVSPSIDIYGRSVEGRALTSFAYGQGGPLVLIIAGIHGSEPAGVRLAQRLRLHVENDPSLLGNVRLVLIENANPDGLDQQQRFNAHGIDLNRNFPAANHNPVRDKHVPSPLCEPESHALHDLIVGLEGLTHVVTLHQPLACIDYDGPEAATRPLAEALAQASGLPVKRLGSRAGSMGSWLGVDRGVPTVTVEFTAEDSARDSDQLWEAYGEMMLAALRVDQTGA
ncbi:MAG: DUF2817 domain-containing protein [Planctomycetota bacterium]